VQRTLSDITDGQKLLFFDHPQHTANGKSASLMYSISYIFMCLQIIVNYSDNSNYC
jgi:hypothetical protein